LNSLCLQSAPSREFPHSHIPLYEALEAAITQYALHILQLPWPNTNSETGNGLQVQRATGAPTQRWRIHGTLHDPLWCGSTLLTSHLDIFKLRWENGTLQAQRNTHSRSSTTKGINHLNHFAYVHLASYITVIRCESRAKALHAEQQWNNLGCFLKWCQ
jgi:hypothetical protein